MTEPKVWCVKVAARYDNGKLIEEFDESFLSDMGHEMVSFAAYESLSMQLESWKAAYAKLTAGDHAEVRLDMDGAIDEVVGSGVFHVEQMDTNRWFFDLAGCRFNINGKKVALTPIEVDTWAEEQKRVAAVACQECGLLEGHSRICPKKRDCIVPGCAWSAMPGRAHCGIHAEG